MVTVKDIKKYANCQRIAKECKLEIGLVGEVSFVIARLGDGLEYKRFEDLEKVYDYLIAFRDGFHFGLETDLNGM